MLSADQQRRVSDSLLAWQRLWPVQPKEALSDYGAAQTCASTALYLGNATRLADRSDYPARAPLASQTAAVCTSLHARPRAPTPTMFARVAARVSRACAMNDTLVASGAVDTKLMWQIPRLALALQCSIPPLDAPCFAVQKSNSNREIAIDATPARQRGLRTDVSRTLTTRSSSRARPTPMRC